MALSHDELILLQRGRNRGAGSSLVRGLRGSSSGILTGQGLSKEERQTGAAQHGESFTNDTIEGFGQLLGDLPAMAAGGTAGTAAGGALGSVAGPGGAAVGAALGGGAGAFAAPEVIKAMYEEYQNARNDLGDISFMDYLKAVASRTGKAAGKGAIFGGVAKALIPFLHGTAAQAVLNKLPKGAAIAGSHAVEAITEAGILGALDTAFDDAVPLEAFRDNLTMVLGAKISMGLAATLKKSMQKHPGAKEKIAKQLLLEYKPSLRERTEKAQAEAKPEEAGKSMVLPQEHELTGESQPLLEHKEGGKAGYTETPITSEQVAQAAAISRNQAEGIAEKPVTKEQRALREANTKEAKEVREAKEHKAFEKEQAIKDEAKKRKESEANVKEKPPEKKKLNEREAAEVEANPAIKLLKDKISESEDNIESHRKALKKDPTSDIERARLEKEKTKLADLKERLNSISNKLSQQYRKKESTQYNNEAIVEKIARAFKIPIRSGKISHPNIHGIYKPHERVIRLQSPGDYVTASHEIGHDLERNLFPNGDYSSIEKFRGELEPIATQPLPGQDTISEGFAEFVSAYTTDPSEARRVAPKFFDHFEETLKAKNPHALEILRRVQEDAQSVANQSPLDYVESRNGYSDSNSKWAQLKRYSGKLYESFKDDPRKFLQSKWSGFYANWVDRAAPIYGFSPEAYRELRNHAGVDAKVMSFIHGQGVTDFKETKKTSESLQKILEPIGKDFKKFDAYLVAMRTLDLSKRDIITGITPEQAKAAVIQGDSTYPQFKKVAEQLQHYQDAVLQYYRDSGMLSQESYAAIKDKNPFYVPLNRVFENTVDMFSPGSVHQLTHKILGSERKIMSPLENISKNTAMMTRMASRNDVLKTFIADTAHKPGIGSILEFNGIQEAKRENLISLAAERSGLDPALFETVSPEILQAMADHSRWTKDGNDIKVFIDGKAHLYNVDPLIYQGLGMLGRSEVPMAVQMMSIPTQSLRSLTTHSPDFIVKTFLKDVVEATIKTQHGITMGDITRGVASALKQDDLYWKWMNAKGGYVSPASLSRKSMLEKSLRLEKSGIYENYKEYAQALESGARIAEFKAGVAKYGDTKEGRAKAAYESREITLDFAKQGVKMQNINRLVAFSAAHINGVDSFVRSFKPRYLENGHVDMKPYYRMALWVGMPSAVLAAMNSGEQWYEQQPAYIRDLFWLTKVGDKVIRIPKPHGYGQLLGNSIEKFVSYTNGHNPNAIKEWKDQLVDQFNVTITPNALAPFIESHFNKTLFTGRTIVPEYRKEMKKYLQYSPYTTELSKKTARVIADIFGDSFSPALAENYIRAWTGTAGYNVLQTIDKAFIKSGAVKAPAIPAWKDATEWPLFRSFFAKYPMLNSRDLEQFWTKHRQQIALESSIRSLMKEGDIEQAKKLMNEGTGKNLKPAHLAMRRMLQSVNAIQNSDQYEADEKRYLIDQIYLQMMAIAQKNI